MASKDPKQFPEKNSWACIVRVIGKVLIWFFAILIVLVLLGWLAIWICLPQEELKRLAIEQLHKQLGATVEIEDLEFHILSGLALNRVTVGPPPGYKHPLLSIERLVVKYSLADLLEGRLNVHEVLLDRPIITFELGPKGSNLFLSKPAALESGHPSEFILDLQTLKIRDAAILIQTPDLQAEWRGLDLDLSGIFGRHAVTNLKASLKLPVPKDPNLALIVQAKRVTAAVGFDLEIESDKPDRFSIKAGIELERLKAGISSAHNAKLELRSQLDLGQDRFDLIALAIKLDNAPMLEASGAIEELSRSARARFEIPSLILSNTALLDAVAQFFPGATLSGRAKLERVVLEKGARTPLRVNGRLVIEGGRFIIPGLSVEGSSAALDVALAPRAEDLTLDIQGSVSATRVKAANVIATQAEGTIAGKVQLLPIDQIYMPGGSSFDFGGQTRLLMTAWGSGQKVALSGRLQFEGIKQQAGEIAILEPSSTIEARAEKVLLVDRRLTIGSVRLHLKTDCREIRLGSNNDVLPPFPLQAMVLANDLSTDAASAQKIEARFSSDLSGWRRDQAPVDAELLVSGLSYRGLQKSLAQIIGKPIVVKLSGGLRTGENEITISRLQVSLEDLFDLQAEGKFNWQTLESDLSFRTGPLILSKLHDFLPPNVRGAVTLRAGRIDVFGHFAGRIPCSLTEPGEFSCKAELSIRPVGVGIAGSLFAIGDLSGKMRLELGGKNPSLARAEIDLQAGKGVVATFVGSNLELSLKAVRAGDDLALDGRLAVAKVDPGSLFVAPLERLELSLDSVLTGLKELRLNKLQAKIGSLGLQADVNGRATWPAGEPGWKGFKALGAIDARFSSPTPVMARDGLWLIGQARASLVLHSQADGIFAAQGSLTFAGLDVTTPGVSIHGLQGVVPISQLVALTPKPVFLSGSSGVNDEGAEYNKRSRAYEGMLFPLQAGERSLALRQVNFHDLMLSDVEGRLDISNGQLRLGKTRARFLQGDVLADTAIVFAPLGTKRLHLEAEFSQINIAGLGALSSVGSSDVNGNVRLDIDLAERKANAEINLTQIGRSTLRSLLATIDPSRANKGVVELRNFLDRYQVSPSRVSLLVRHGQATIDVVMEMGLKARLAARFIEGFDGDTYRLPPLPVSGILGKYLGF